MRLTVEQDIIFPWIPNERVEEMKQEPIFQKYLIDAGNLTRGLVSCTGAQVCMRLSTVLHGEELMTWHSRQVRVMHARSSVAWR